MSTIENAKKLKVDELKTELKKRGIRFTNKDRKNDLLDALINYLSQEILCSEDLVNQNSTIHYQSHDDEIEKPLLGNHINFYNQLICVSQ